MSKYKRLTTKCEVGIGLTETSGNIVNDYEKVVNRLADLEDKIESGELIDIKQLETENTELKARLKNAVELKAKVGDTIYLPWEYDGVYGIATLHITSITILGSGVFYITDFDCGADYIYSEKYKNGVYLNTDFKVTVFTNCAEAEAKLAELRCNI